ncbi:acetyl-CoA acetyltransferase [Zavarzinia compransoris]|uniref:acetyl-CoA acetyltransferase n=1 Tax=Zavarzinia marina TaxID=2911065 RepID=UPI001F4105CE|nr:acetyl-CoA acetyltransferase [Zavarzinia marina]MCF4167247.1 acetyl-CoA acetyltransferase [Zavarzinia marina]
MSDETTAVLIGVGQITQKDVDPAAARGPIEMMRDAARLAAADAGIDGAALSAVDRLAVVRFMSGQFDDPVADLAQMLDAHPKDREHTPVGGNSPQMLVNETAEKIARGEVKLALLAGVEVLSTITRAQKMGIEIPFGQITLTEEDRNGSLPVELMHGLFPPVNVYPLFENALRAKRGRSLKAHLLKIGELFAPFTKVAAANPLSWFPIERSIEELVTPSAKNRFVGYPYTKLVNAIMEVDQSAAVIMASVAEAKRLGVPKDKWVYLHGCADAKDHWFVLERVNYHSSPAIRTVGRETFEMAGKTVADMRYFDIYSCFPSAVQIAKQELALPEVDEIPLTVTGGLPYFGGPGNNYVMHSIAEMAVKLRADPGAYGLVTANGWYVTKHAAGIYSTEPPTKPFVRKDPALYQAEIDAEPKPEIATEAEGAARIETYTVVHGRDGAPYMGIVIGRLEDGRRFVANTPGDADVLDLMLDGEAIGRKGKVTTSGGQNTFDPR